MRWLALVVVKNGIWACINGMNTLTKSKLTEDSSHYVDGIVIEKNKGDTNLENLATNKTEESKNKRIENDATRAYMFAVKGNSGNRLKNGGYKLTHQPSSYGIALKWLIFIRGMSYSTFASRYNGTTAQNANHLINRIDKKRFFAENVEKMCNVLGVSYEYFVELCEKIEEKMEK